MSQVHVVKRKRQCSSEPTEVPEKEQEELFFNHFAQFGIMEYCRTIRHRQDRLSHGYVKYYHEESARRALQQSDVRYRAIAAQCQYAPLCFIGEKFVKKSNTMRLKKDMNMQ